MSPPVLSISYSCPWSESKVSISPANDAFAILIACSALGASFTAHVPIGAPGWLVTFTFPRLIVPPYPPAAGRSDTLTNGLPSWHVPTHSPAKGERLPARTVAMNHTHAAARVTTDNDANQTPANFGNVI